jgi:hypothetical protein
MVGIKPRIGPATTQKQDATIGTAAKIVASMHQVDVAALVAKYCAAGVFEEVPGQGICPNCGNDMTGAYCRKCNQSAEDGDPLDHDEGEEDREVDDHSDSEDADEPSPLDEEDDSGLWSEASKPSFNEVFSKYLESLGIPDAKIPLYLYLLKGAIEQGKVIDDPLTPDLVKAAADWSGQNEEFLQTLWAKKPFDQNDFDEIFQEWFAESGSATPAEYEEPLLEIRKVNGEYLSIVHDRSEDLTTAPGKRNSLIPIEKTRIPAGLFLMSLRKRNHNLQLILETLVERRRDFLDAPTRDDALKALRERPLELTEIADATGIDRGIISRHFSTKSVLTPHGIFMLRELTSQKSSAGEEITVYAVREKVIDVIRRGDSKSSFHTDAKVAEILKKEYRVEVSREYVKKIRKECGIPSSRERRAKGSR